MAEDTYEFEGVLWLNENESLYIWKAHKDEVWEQTHQEGDNIYGQTVFTDIYGYQIKRSLKDSNLICREFCTKQTPVNYLDESNIKWTISADRKIIGGYEVIKATSKFRGRNYLAWFSDEIPVNAGPWKFNGLPGLILEVTSTDGAVKFLLSELKTIQDQVYPRFHNEESQITRIEFNDCMDKAYEKIYKKSEAAIAKLQAEFKDIDLELTLPKERIKTEISDK